MSDFDQQLDARDLRCPMPLLKAKQALARLGKGQLLEVLTTDPGSVRDFSAWLAQVDDELLAQDQEGAVYVFHIRKG